jgi:pimeloyl-ACP methyl ester carboxylesterase
VEINLRKEKKEMFVFNDMKSKEKYKVAYIDRLKEWEVEYTTRFIETDYGRSFVIECGKKNAPPLMLLHGFSGTSTMWKSIATNLKNNFHIFAVDIISDINLSEPSKKIEKSKDFADWLHQTVIGLGIQKCYVMGESYGGWQIMNCAYRYENLFLKAIIINPMPGLTNFTLGGNVKFIMLALNHSRKSIEKFLKEMVFNKERVEESFINLVYTAFQSGKTGIPSDGYVLKEEALQKITMPTVYLIGDKDVFASLESRLGREKALNENSKMVVVVNSGHDIVTDNPEIILETVKIHFQ